MSDSRSCRENKYQQVIFNLETRVAMASRLRDIHTRKPFFADEKSATIVDLTGFEPVTSALQMLRSTS